MNPVGRLWSLIPAFVRPWLGVAVAGVGILALDEAGLFRKLEVATLDSRFQIREALLPSRETPDDLLIVGVGESDLEILGRWPWPRSIHGDLVSLLAAVEPKVIAFDVLFTEKTDDAEGNAYLAEAAAAAPVVVGAMSEFGSSAESSASLTPLNLASGNLEALPDRGNPLLPYDALAAAAAIGFVNASPDQDGIYRRLPLFVRWKDQLFPTLSTSALMKYWGITAEQVTVHLGKSVSFPTPDGLVEVPIDDLGRVRLNFRSVSDLEAQSVRPYTDTFNTLQLHLIEEEPWRQEIPHPGGSIVLIGVTAEGIDVGATPLRPVTPLPYLHAQAVENILTGDFLHTPPRWLTFAGWWLITCVILLYVRRASILNAIALPAVLILVYLVTSGTLFTLLSLDLPLVWTVVGFASFQYGSILQRWYLDHEAKVKTEAELRAAGEIQMGMLPKMDRILQGKTEQIDLAAFLEPAKENSGDFYDVFWLDENRICLVVGDVCDKGIAASTFMVMAKTIIHALAQPDLGQIVTQANAALAAQNERGMFATILMAIVDLRSRQMVYTTPGHHGPVLVSPQGEVVELPATEDFAVGPLDGIDYKVLQHQLAPGEVVFLCTDGVTEAFNEKKEEFGMERTLSVLNRQSSGSSCQDRLDGMHAEILSFAGRHPQSDDITMMAFRFLPSRPDAPAPAAS